MKPKNVLREIQDITEKLISSGLADDFKIPSLNTEGVISWSGAHDISISMKNIPYKDIYNKLNSSRNYNFKLPDGGLLQLLYTFETDKLTKHRLAFFPSPDFDEFQNNPDIYLNDEIYGDVVNRQVMPVIIRADYNESEIDSPIHHPFSHLTLGQYKNCRIPIEGPLTPRMFIKFILEHFYYIPQRSFVEDDFNKYVLSDCIHISDKDRETIFIKCTS